MSGSTELTVCLPNRVSCEMDRTSKMFQCSSMTAARICLFHMDGVDLDMGKLAMWRLASHCQFGGTWLSDYLPNQLGVNMDEKPIQREKPDCSLIGQDGNIYNLMGIASRTLKE